MTKVSEFRELPFSGRVKQTKTKIIKLQFLLEGEQCNEKAWGKGVPKHRDWRGLSSHRIWVVPVLLDKVISVCPNMKDIRG